MNPKSKQQLRKNIVGELSRVQLYAKDHPYDITAGDEKDIEHAVNQIMQAFESFHTGEVERAYVLGSRKTLQDFLIHLPKELSSDKAIKLLNEYVVLLKLYADIKNRHQTTVKGLLAEAVEHLQSTESDKS